VRVVMLHRDELDVLALERVLGRQVLRVQVMGHDLRGHREQAPEVRDALGEGPEGLVVLQVADVMGDERVIVRAQAERALQLGAAAEHRPPEARPQPDRLGHVAPGPAHDHLPAAEPADHRVVGAHVDRPVMDAEGVGDAAQPRQRVLVVVGDRLIRGITAGQHHRTAQRAD
jgi:hypothetical protein